MRTVLFPLLAKTPVFGGGGGGGGGGGSDSGGGLSVTASTKGSSGGGGYTSIKDMFDGGGPGQSGSTFGGALGGISNALGASPIGSGGGGGGGGDRPAIATGVSTTPAVAVAPTGGLLGFGQDYNNDGRISFGETIQDMTDAGGPGGTGGAYSGGPLAGISNVVTGQFDSVADMLDGGGPGQSGPQFEGSLIGSAANLVGLPPLGQGSGVVSGVLDKIATAPESSTPSFDALESRPDRSDQEPIVSPATPVVSEPAPAAPIGPPPVSMGFLPPQIAQVGLDAVMGGTPAFGGDPRARPSDLGPFVFSGFRPDISPVEPVPPPPRPIPMPQPQPVSDMYGMPLALSAPAVRVPQLAQFFPPPVPPYTPAAERPAPIGAPRPVEPRPIPGVTPLPGPTLDPKGGASGSIPPGGIATLAAPAATGIINRMV